MALFSFQDTIRMGEVVSYIEALPYEQAELCLLLDDFFARELHLSSKISFRIPFYYGRSWVCYLNPRKDLSVELCFLEGPKLVNISALLASRGRKMVVGMLLRPGGPLPWDEIRAVAFEALALDRAKPIRKAKP